MAQEKYWYLKSCDLFEQLAADQLSRLESRCRIRKFPRHNPVYLPADLADGVMLLADGQVRICNVTPEGKQSILTFIEKGEVFGELALFGAVEREEFAETVKASTVLLIPADAMHELIEEQPTVSLAITRLMGLRRRRMERRLKYLLFRSNRDRLIHLILELVEQYGQATSDGVELGIKLSHQDLANVIGSTRETVTVTLGQLQEERLVEVGRKTIKIKDLKRLAESVSAAPPNLDQPVSPVPGPGKRHPASIL